VYWTVGEKDKLKKSGKGQNVVLPHIIQGGAGCVSG
jgi:hypothetical protein